MVSAHRRQHRHPPFVVPVVRGALQFKPYALADFGFGRERCFQNVVPGVNWVEPKGSLEKAEKKLKESRVKLEADARFDAKALQT